MTPMRIAYMPLPTFPQAIEDGAIQAATSFAASLKSTLHVTTFAVEIPRLSSGLGDLLLDTGGLVHTAEENSRAQCHRLQGLVHGAAGSNPVHCATRKVAWGAVMEAAAAEARYFDLTLLPWSGETVAAQDIAQAVVFGSGRPAILVPNTAHPASIDHIAIAWDESRVAARALGDALPFLAEGGRVSVLTVQGEKPLPGSNPAVVLASWLEKRGLNATPIEIPLGKRTVAEALQDTALSNGGQLLAMGGYGHSRIRDFILGGATKGVLTRLRIPVLLSH
jgi:nucleotide-binding universal stress UspA family protein